MHQEQWRIARQLTTVVGVVIAPRAFPHRTTQPTHCTFHHVLHCKHKQSVLERIVRSLRVALYEGSFQASSLLLIDESGA